VGVEVGVEGASGQEPEALECCIMSLIARGVIAGYEGVMIRSTFASREGRGLNLTKYRRV
jgi:hypothetical protein